MLLSLFLGLAQWALGTTLPDSVPEILRVADKKAMEEIGKSLTAATQPSLTIPLMISTLLGSIVLIGATIASFIGLFMFKWWARRLTLLTIVVGILDAPFFKYFLFSGLDSAFGDAQMLLWGCILSLAYFSPVSECFARNER
jgi:hypothetical protein